MLGIGYHLDKWTKQKILQEKANQYNKVKDSLTASGTPYSEVSKKVQEHFYAERHKGDAEGEQQVLGIGGSLNLGYTNSHKTISEAREMNRHIESNEPKKGMLGRKEQKEMDQKMKKRIYQDHIDLMTKGVKFSDKPQGSEYRERFQFSQQMQKECDQQDFTYHQRKNDLKWYSEEYAKIKGVMRK